MQKWLLGTVLAIVISLALAGESDAQVLGTFCWQLQPAQFGEIVRFAVETQADVFALSGFDILPASQGGGRFGTFGTAFQRTDGQFGLSFTTVFDGFSSNTQAVINAFTLSGTWTDDSGNSGQFVNQACP
jgi:hypothetical protein